MTKWSRCVAADQGSGRAATRPSGKAQPTRLSRRQSRRHGGRQQRYWAPADCQPRLLALAQDRREALTCPKTGVLRCGPPGPVRSTLWPAPIDPRPRCHSESSGWLPRMGHHDAGGGRVGSWPTAKANGQSAGFLLQWGSPSRWPRAANRGIKRLGPARVHRALRPDRPGAAPHNERQNHGISSTQRRKGRSQGKSAESPPHRSLVRELRLHEATGDVLHAVRVRGMGLRR